MAAAINWGTVPDWLAAIGTTLAFAVALTVLLRDRDERQAQQAHLMLCWTEDTEATNGGQYLDLVVRNASSAPVYDVWMTAPVPLYIGPVENQRHYLPVVPPGERRLSSELRNSTQSLIGIKCEFTDASGVRWERHLNGRLTRRPTWPLRQALVSLLIKMRWGIRWGPKMTWPTAGARRASERGRRS